MEVELENIGSTLVVKLKGELDQHFASTVREKIDRELQSSGSKNLIFDFKDVTFMDSSGIGVIVGRYKKVTACGGKMMIIRIQPQIDKIFEISGLKKLLECS